MDQLPALLRQRRAAPVPVEALEPFAPARHRLFGAAARAAVGPAVARFALDVPGRAVAGARSQRVVRGTTTAPRAGGPVRVARRGSRQGDAEARAVCSLDLGAGILAGSWRPWAAQPATGVGAPLRPPAGAARLAVLGQMPPSTRP